MQCRGRQRGANGGRVSWGAPGVDHDSMVQGNNTIPQQRRNLTSKVQAVYELHFGEFGCKVGDQEKEWAPHVCCLACYSLLLQWLAGKKGKMPFAVPMIWRVPSNHDTDCYFCMTCTVRWTKKTIKDTVSWHLLGLNKTSSSWCWKSCSYSNHCYKYMYWDRGAIRSWWFNPSQWPVIWERWP